MVKTPPSSNFEYIEECISSGRTLTAVIFLLCYPCVQVFSRQAVQMDALISAFVEDIKQRAALYNEDSEGNLFTDNAVNEADGERKIL